MIKQYTIIDEAGLHARPASVLVQAASKFSNNITLEFIDKRTMLARRWHIRQSLIWRQIIIKYTTSC